MFALERRPSSETEVPYVSGIFSRTLQISFARVHVYLYFLYIVLRNSGRDWHRWKRKQLTRREHQMQPRPEKIRTIFNVIADRHGFCYIRNVR